MVTPFVGVWIETSLISFIRFLFGVTPFVGVWIETFCIKADTTLFSSHPSWVCGLKLSRRLISALLHPVTPFVGVWIETPAPGQRTPRM